MHWVLRIVTEASKQKKRFSISTCEASITEPFVNANFYIKQKNLFIKFLSHLSSLIKRKPTADNKQTNK